MEQNQDPTLDPLHQLELTISKLLRTGVLLAGMFLAIGWVWLWIQNGDMLSSFTTYEPKSFMETIHWALLMNDRPMIISLIGMVILVCLPVARVFMTGVLFIKQKDRVLAIMAFAVFAVLIASFCLGIDL
ncbi:DUF1634 domain-containing protein [Bdellovibrio sp. NC01]|uniref:DUF1634 domain-containing protein n=1 Tax=Bdellovibrio sp. NC01 TaxID=2220073 RepID=UPI001157CD68|nr:DUF1634 domain-containing protein [Bdellovibrio sp. NC01]QDK38035.1 DUF1634 domain-containing protein [Bdellovibrio sp. NC01]